MRALTSLVLGVLLFAPAVTVSAGTWPGFIAPDSYSFTMPSGEVTWSAVGDLNGDGYPEVLFIDASYLQIMVNHAGTLAPGARYTVSTIKRVLIADMNRDGRLDVVVVGGLTGVLLGKGDGTLQPGLFMYGPGDDAALGDFNGDGYPDLVIVGSLGVQVRMNDRQGGFGDLVTLPSLPNTATRVMVADTNRDGINDLVVLNGHISVLPGKGDGTFGLATVADIAATAIAVGDANRDANPDIYYTTGSGMVGVLLGNGDGSFRTTPTVAAGLNPQAISLGDFDGDSVTDLAISSFGDEVDAGTAAGGLVVLLGNLDCTFRKGKRYAFSGAQNPAADLNGDGKVDLIIGGAAVAFGNGDGTFRAVEQIGFGGLVAHSAMATADFNNDGAMEFAITGPGDQVEILSELAGKWSNRAVGLLGWHVATGDFNGDGNQDLIATGGENQVSVVHGDGNGSFTAVRTTSLDTSGDHVIATGRLNQDKFDDAVVLTGATLEVLMGREDGTFSIPISVALENGDGVRVLIADLNQDGFGDIVVQHGVAFSMLMGDAAGRYLDQRFLSAAGRLGGMLLQDVNADAIPDLIYSASTLDKVFVLLGDGKGGFATGAAYSVILPREVAVGDINGDGLPDLMVCNNYAGLATLLGTPQHGFSAARYWYGNVNQSNPVVTEVNGDSVPDIVTLDKMAAVSLFINKGWDVPPSPMLAMSENSIDFGSQRMWSSSVSHSIKITNKGNVNLSLRFSVGNDFKYTEHCGILLPVGSACMVSVSFRPVRVGWQTEYLVVNSGTYEEAASLTGVGVDVSISLLRPSRNSRNVSEHESSPASNGRKAKAVGVAVEIIPRIPFGPGPSVLSKNEFLGPQASKMLSQGIVSSRHSVPSGKVSECACGGDSPVRFTGPFAAEGDTSVGGGSDETASNSHLEGRSARGRRKHFNRQRSIREDNLHERHQRDGCALHESRGTSGCGRGRVHLDDGRKRTGQGRHYAGMH